jgi:hypothetical protein
MPDISAPLAALQALRAVSVPAAMPEPAPAAATEPEQPETTGGDAPE